MSELSSSGLDAIVEMDAAAGRAAASRNVTASLEIFDTHFPRFPVYPGVLVLAGLAELCDKLLGEARGGDWRLTAVDRIRFRRYVQPGDTVRYEVAMLRAGDREVELSGSARVQTGAVASAARLHFVKAG